MTLTGKHLINGNWIAADDTFQSMPAHGPAHTFTIGTRADVDAACVAAEDAFWSFGYSSRATRAEFLNSIADQIDERADDITEIGTQETGLPEARLQGERGRTTGQLRLFAQYILQDDYLDQRHDTALPDRQPLPRPDLKLMQRPLGPVAVFGASNFPLAFSTAGGDTAAALAAGCPVVVKGHPAHPGTSEIIAQAIHAAIIDCDLHPGVFALIQSDGFEVGQALVQHDYINAVGFTGSLNAGRALFDLCAARPDPIPFFGELGSVNPMFLLPAAMRENNEGIARNWAGSLTMGAGQFCTNPGVAILMKGENADTFIQTAAKALGDTSAQTMLTDNIAAAYRDGRDTLRAASTTQDVLMTECDGRTATPALLKTTGAEWLGDTNLSHEIFGPIGLVVVVDDFEQMVEVAKSLKGQLTCTIHMIDADQTEAQKLMPILERKAGRILMNGFPTGVEVAGAMVHGGPYPASTNFGHTSVGTLSIRRFLRPVCYQNVPEAILPTV